MQLLKKKVHFDRIRQRSSAEKEKDPDKLLMSGFFHIMKKRTVVIRYCAD